MSATRWASLVGSLLLVCGCSGDGDGDGDGGPDELPDAGVPDPTVANDCKDGSQQSQVLMSKASLLGQTQTHLYMHAVEGILKWPKSGGVPRIVAHLPPLFYRQHLVSEEGILSVELDGEGAQLITFDGQRSSLNPPEGTQLRFAAVAPGGGIFVLTSGNSAASNAIYRLRPAERSFELVHRLEASGLELQAQDDAVYWLRNRPTGVPGDYDVMEHRLGTPGERVLASLDSHQQLLQVFPDFFYVRAGLQEIVRRDRMTGEPLATFPTGYSFGVLVQKDQRLFLSTPPGMQYSPSCPPPAGLYELREGQSPQLLIGDVAPTAVFDGEILYYRRAYPTCCQSGNCSGGGESVACHRL